MKGTKIKSPKKNSIRMALITSSIIVVTAFISILSILGANDYTRFDKEINISKISGQPVTTIIMINEIDQENNDSEFQIGYRTKGALEKEYFYVYEGTETGKEDLYLPVEDTKIYNILKKNESAYAKVEINREGITDISVYVPKETKVIDENNNEVFMLDKPASIN